jgi:hypothetical protein
MSGRPILGLKKRPDPSTKPKVDPAKVSLSESFGWRFIERDHRYILQKLYVTYGGVVSDQTLSHHPWQSPPTTELSRTWVDVPLVPETYVG